MLNNVLTRGCHIYPRVFKKGLKKKKLNEISVRKKKEKETTRKIKLEIARIY